MKPIVVVESPFAGDVERNLRYLRAAMRDCIRLGEAPYASHALYTQPGVLDDGSPEDRKLGMEAGFEFKRVAAYTVVYEDLGISLGMQAGIDASRAKGFEYKFRKLGEDWEGRAIEVEKTFKTMWPEELHRQETEIAVLEQTLVEREVDVFDTKHPRGTKIVEGRVGQGEHAVLVAYDPSKGEAARIRARRSVACRVLKCIENLRAGRDIADDLKPEAT